MVERASATVRLPSDTVVRFVGDLHLGDGAHNDTFGHNDHRLVEFLRECESSCDAVVFMGDAFDLPQAWTVRRIGRAHPDVVRAIERLSQHLPVFFILGNHDWTVDYAHLFPRSQACERLIIGETLVMHGHQIDRYCHPNRSFHRFKVTLHHIVERIFGFNFRIPIHQHNTWQNRVAHWLGAQYGRYLRRMAVVYRFLGLEERASECEAFIHYWSRALWGDNHALFEPATDLIRRGDYSALVCGHTHIPCVMDMGEGRHYINAGSWTFDRAEAAAWDGEAFEAIDIVSGDSVGDRHYRWMISGSDPGDFLDWWAAHYRGWLRFNTPAGAPAPFRGEKE